MSSNESDDQAENGVTHPGSTLLDAWQLPTGVVAQEGKAHAPRNARQRVSEGEAAVGNGTKTGQGGHDGTEEGGEASGKDVDRTSPSEVIQRLVDGGVAFLQHRESQESWPEAIADEVTEIVTGNCAQNDQGDEHADLYFSLRRHDTRDQNCGFARQDETEKKRCFGKDHERHDEVDLEAGERLGVVQERRRDGS